MTATGKMIQFILETKYEDVPPIDLQVIKHSCFDNIGTILAGAAQPVGKIIAEYTKETGGTPESTVLGTGLRTSATMAALANGTMGHALDYDDTGGYGHPTTSLFPALLAIGEKIGATGRDLLTAYVVGFETAAALSRSGGYNQYEGGFHSTPLFGTIASAAGVARLLNLNKEQTRMALAIAGSEASGLQRNNGSMTKPFHAGMACRNGVTAGLLAKKGFTAHDDIFEAKTGFMDTFVGEGRYNLNTAAEKLGHPFTAHTQLGIKRYPCCGGNHTALDAIFALIQENDIDYDDVVRVDADAFSYTSPVLRFPEPKLGLQGKFSVRHNLAAAILDKKVVIETHTDEKIKDPKMREAWQKVHTHVMTKWDPRLAAEERGGNPVTITMKDGRVLSKTVTSHDRKGSPGNRISNEELISKFRQNARLSLPEKVVETAVDQWLSLENIADVSQAVKPLAGGTARRA